jgi:hypothetical protein
MPRPKEAAERPDLQAVIYEAADPTNAFIGLRVMPIFKVDEPSSQFPVIPADVMFSLPNTRRAPRSRYPRSDWEWEWDNYNTVENGWEEPVDDKEVNIHRRYFDAEKMAGIRAVRIILRNQEKRIADAVFNESNFTPNAVTDEWDDYENAAPIDDVKAGRKEIHGTIGIDPNTLIISYSTFLDLGMCGQIIDRIKYTNPAVQRGDVAAPLLAQAFGVDQILVGGSLYNGAKKGQDASLSSIWSNEYAMLCRTSESEMLTEAPCLGRTFLWTTESPTNTVVESYRDEGVRGDVIRVRHETDEEFISPECGYLLSNITTN